MRYSGFVTRSCANGIDMMVTFPLILIYLTLSQKSLEMCVVASIILVVIHNLYFIISHKIFGQTLGKWLIGIKVIREDADAPLLWRHSLARSLGDIVLGSFRILGVLSASLVMIKHSYNPVDWPFLESRFQSFNPTLSWLGTATLAWTVSESITLLFSATRQSFQDLIGRTRVTHTPTNHIIMVLFIPALLVTNLYMVDWFNKIYILEPNKTILTSPNISREVLEWLVLHKKVKEKDNVIWIYQEDKNKNLIILTDKHLIQSQKRETKRIPLKKIRTMKKEYNFGDRLDILVGFKEEKALRLRNIPRQHGKNLYNGLFFARNHQFPRAKTLSISTFGSHPSSKQQL